MPNYRTKVPKILWGAAFANTLAIGYWLDNTAAGDEPRPGSEVVQAPSGIEEAWTIGTDFLLTGEVRYIPPTDTATPVATGWDGATGFRAFLAWARDKNVIRFYPDATAGTSIDCYLVEPMTGQAAPEADGTRRVVLKLRNTTTAFDGY
jgi:hypothetical protein